MTSLTKTESALLIGFFAVISIPLLYLGRHLDNNTLSSWRWVFNGQSLSIIILFCLLATICSYCLSRTSFLERQPVFWIFSLSFLVCSSLWREPELLLDSGRYFLQAKQVSEFGVHHFIRQWGEAIPAWTDMPLIPLLYGIIFDIFGEDRVAIQLFNSLLFSLSTVLTFLSAQILIGKQNSLYAGLLLLGMPYLLTQVPLLLVDINALFFFSLALYMFLVALLDGGTYKILWAATCIVLAMLSKYSIWPMLLILPLLVVNLSPSSPDRLRRSALIFLFVALLASILLIPKLHVVMEQISILRNYQRPALLQWHESLLSTFFFQIHPLITFFGCVSLFRAIRKGTGQLVIIGIFTLFFCFKVQRIRYIIPLLPLIAIIAANGLDTLKFPQTRRFVCWLCVSFSLVILHCAYLPFFQQTAMSNIQSAGAYLDSLGSDIIAVTTLPQSKSNAPTYVSIPQLDLFTKKNIIAPQRWSSSENRPQGYHPLLFTWEMKKPIYYGAPQDTHDISALPLAVISDAPIDDSAILTLKGDISLKTIKRFSTTSRIFRYTTFVTVIH